MSRSWVVGVLLAGLAACGVPRTATVPELVGRLEAGDAAAAAELVARMGRGAPRSERSRAYVALLAVPDGIEQAVRNACRSPDPVLREHALALAANRRWAWAAGEATVALGDPEFPRRYVGAWALGELGAAGAADALLDALESGGETAREAARALVKLGPAAVPRVLERLPTLGDDARGYAVRVLGDTGAPSAVPALLAALENPATRADAAWALGRCGDRAAGPALVRLLGDPDRNVRMQAVRALGLLETAVAEQSLDRLRRQDPERAVREWAARSLAILRGTPQTYPDDRGVPVLPDALYR